MLFIGFGQRISLSLGLGDFSTTLEMTVYIMSFRAERSAVEESPGPIVKNSRIMRDANNKLSRGSFDTCIQSKNASDGKYLPSSRF